MCTKCRIHFEPVPTLEFTAAQIKAINLFYKLILEVLKHLPLANVASKFTTVAAYSNKLSLTPSEKLWKRCFDGITICQEASRYGALLYIVCSVYLLCIKTWNMKTRFLYGPRQANLVLIAYASSEGSGEPAHPRSLARTSAARSY